MTINVMMASSVPVLDIIDTLNSIEMYGKTPDNDSAVIFNNCTNPSLRPSCCHGYHVRVVFTDGA